MVEFFKKIFASDFLPHGACYLWNPSVLWLNVISDLIITAAYYVIPILLFVFLRKRKDFTLNWIVGAFAVFILACGTTHLLGVWTVWHATYRLDGVVKAITAAASITTALMLAPMLPKLVHLPNPTQLIAMNRKLEEEAKQLAESAETLRRHADLLEMAHDAIIVREVDGTILSWNKGAERLYGWPREEALGRVTHDLFKTRHPAGVASILNELARSGHWEGELMHCRRDGAHVIVLSRWVSRRTEEGRNEILEINTDVTDRKNIKRVLREKNDALEKASTAKDVFLSSMSHELRTPLNAVIGFAGTLLMRLAGPLTPDQERQLKTIQASGKQLLSMINDVLDLAKIESGKIEVQLEEMSCQEVLAEVASALRPLAESKSLSFDAISPEGALLVRTERRVLSQIVFNLGNNAIKLTESGSVRLELAEWPGQGPGWAAVHVVDSGKGLNAEEQEELHRALARAISGSQLDGLGLGLHLCVKLAALISGRIEFQSEYGRGSRFTLLIPRG